MARSLDYRSTSEHPADEVYAVMVDPEYLRARLLRMGGPGAQLLEHRVDPDGARYRLRHGLQGGDLPPIITAFLPGSVMIERTETITRRDAGSYAGEVTVAVRGTPASAAGWMRLTDRGGTGSEFVVHADVTVQVPFIGGPIEAAITDQVKKLLAAETAFTHAWLDGDR